MPENVTDRDHVQRMVFTLPVDETLFDPATSTPRNPLQVAELIGDIFDTYVATVLPYPHWRLEYPEQVLNIRNPDGYPLWQATYAVLKLNDEDR